MADPRVMHAALGEMRLLLRDFAQHTDATLVTMMQDLLQHYGFWSDEDADAAAERRAAFNKEVAGEDRAYDGWSCEPQKRALTPREREIVGRIIRDAVRSHRPTPGGEGLELLVDGESRVMVSPAEIQQLEQIGWVIAARHD